MPTLHFLNVRQGDCTWIKHGDGRNTVIDICNGRASAPKPSPLGEVFRSIFEEAEEAKGSSGNFRQKDYPVNPIDYLKSFGETSIHRFILTHPDMDHMDGLVELFRQFSPVNFWDTDNRKEMNGFDESRYSREDWEFYRALRRQRSASNPCRLTLFSGAKGPFFNQYENGTPGGNGLYVLAPTREILASANDCGKFNDCSYVLLWSVQGKRIVIGGDSHDVSWQHILETYGSQLENVDLLIAPHHGRKSDRSYEFLKVLKPKLTFFGIARREHLGYNAWSSRGLEVMTNNQGNCFVVDINQTSAAVYCTNGSFARAYCREDFGGETFWNESLRAWYLRCIN